MLRAALIGFSSSGKSTLFQLMTSLRESGRSASGKGETLVGISKVPDSRLDRLTAMFNPRKRVAATVEFSDMAATGQTAGAQTLVDVVAYKNADALVHVLRAFQDPAVPHPAGSINPARDAQAMEDELILADLGVAERRLERLEKDLKKARTADLERERDVLTVCRAALEEGRPLRALDLKGEDLKRLRGFQFLSAKPLLIVINLDESQLSAEGEGANAGGFNDRAADAAGLTPFLSRAGTAAAAVCAKIELEIAQLEAADAAAFLADLGLKESGLDRVIRASYDLLGLHLVFHGRRRRMPRVVDSARDVRPTSRPAKSTATSRGDSSGPRSSATIRWSPAARWPRAAIAARFGSKARITSSRTATSSISDSPHRRAGIG